EIPGRICSFGASDGVWRTLPRGVSSRSQAYQRDSARVFEWPPTPMCSFVVLTTASDEVRPSGGPVQTDIDPRNLIGRKAFDRDGTRIGTVDEVYLDDATGVPEWAAIRTGLFSRDAFVPLGPSELVDGTLHVPFDRALIKDAPDFGVGRHLSPDQE